MNTESIITESWVNQTCFKIKNINTLWVDRDSPIFLGTKGGLKHSFSERYGYGIPGELFLSMRDFEESDTTTALC